MRRIWPHPTVVLDDLGIIDAYALDRTQASVRVNFVTSIDGAVEVGGVSEGLSNEADQTVFKVLRMHCDALLVGAGTLRHEGYRAVRLDEVRRAWRRERGLSDYPTLAVVSSSLDLDADQAAFADAPVRPVVLTHAVAPADRRAKVEGFADVVTCGEASVDLAAGLEELRRRGLRHVLCEGGPHLFGALLAKDLVHELCLTVAPLLAGPGAGRIVAGANLTMPLGMRIAHVIAADEALLTRYIRAS